MIDMDKYKDAEALEVMTGSTSYDSESWLYKTGLLPLIARALLNLFRFQVWKLVFAGILTVSGIGIANRDKIASMLARDDYHGALSLIMRDKNIKSEYTNHHPVYDSEFAKEIERKYKIDLRKKFWFYTDPATGIEYLVMRDVVWEHGRPLELEQSAVFSFDQYDYCDRFNGEVPDRQQLIRFGQKMRIQKYDGELAADEGGKGMFRCIINVQMFNALEDGDKE